MRSLISIWVLIWALAACTGSGLADPATTADGAVATELADVATTTETDAVTPETVAPETIDDDGFDGPGFSYLVVDPVEVDFGIRPIDDVLTRDIDLENAGNRPLHVTRIGFIGADGAPPSEAFGTNHGAGLDLAPGAHATVKLTFYVLAEVPYEDVLRFESDSATGPMQIRVSGGGIILQCVDRDGDLHGDYCDAGPDCDDLAPGVFRGAAEVCNGKDDDCDGLTDEDYVALGKPCAQDFGACMTVGANVCTADGVGVACATNPVTGGDELCNQEDDDCDGATDEDFPQIGKLCSVGQGVCLRTDKWVCAADGAGVACNVEPGPKGVEVEGNTLDDDCDGKTDESPERDVGCADGEREGFVDVDTWPDIAACSGAWRIGGVVTDQLAPTCGRLGGDDGDHGDGEGCNVADMCAAGWHVCVSSADVASHSTTGCTGSSPEPGLFFVARQSGTGCAQCATGTTTGGSCNSPYSCLSGCAPSLFLSNDVFGCGSMGAAPNASCAPLDKFSHNNCYMLAAPWACSGGTVEAANISKGGPDHGGALCCRD